MVVVEVVVGVIVVLAGDTDFVDDIVAVAVAVFFIFTVIVIGCWLSVVPCWLLIVFCWLLVVCCWLLVFLWLVVCSRFFGCCLLIVGCLQVF